MLRKTSIHCRKSIIEMSYMPREEGKFVHTMSCNYDKFIGILACLEHGNTEGMADNYYDTFYSYVPGIVDPY